MHKRTYPSIYQSTKPPSSPTPKAAATLGLLALAGSANGFVSQMPKSAAPAIVKPSTTAMAAKAGAKAPDTKGAEQVFGTAMSTFKSDYPNFAARGWGPSAKAERWNGRHAMFGWFFIICTGYAQAHGLIPNPDQALNLKTWGTLATISGTETIKTERAVILIANVHALMVSICAAFLPLGYMDKLLLDDGEEDEPAAGVFPPFETGLTAGAEMWNGRMAMMGIVTATSYSLVTGTPFMDTVNLWLGGLLIPK